jgi:hypothetical protein
VKRIFEEYEFVRGRSGVGWDDVEKKATAETEYIERFTEVHSANSALKTEPTRPRNTVTSMPNASNTPVRITIVSHCSSVATRPLARMSCTSRK